MIGELQEKNLHHYLKKYLEEDEKYHEIKVGSFFADIKKDDKIIEVQTQSFDKLRNKLNYYLPLYKVEVVYPICKLKNLKVIDEVGNISLRKSPKIGSIYDSIRELYKIKTYLDKSNLEIKLIFLTATEERYKTKVNRKGFSKINTIPTEIVEEVILNDKNSYLVFIDGLSSEFKSSDLSKIKNINKRLSSLTLHILKYLNVIKIIRKDGRSYVYERSTND